MIAAANHAEIAGRFSSICDFSVINRMQFDLNEGEL